MAIDVRTLEGRWRELRNITLMEAKRKTQAAIVEINYLILSTSTGKRRNIICDANIHLMAALNALAQLSSEES